MTGRFCQQQREPKAMLVAEELLLSCAVDILLQRWQMDDPCAAAGCPYRWEL